MHRYVLALSAFLIGCSGVDSTVGSDARSDLPPLQLKVSVEPTSLERGETMEIQFVVTNTSSEHVSKGFSSGCIYGYSLRNGDGDIVAPPPPICTANAPIIQYQPGQVVTRDFHWEWDDPDLQPGVYELVVGFGPRGEGDSAPPVKVHLR